MLLFPKAKRKNNLAIHKQSRDLFSIGHDHTQTEVCHKNKSASMICVLFIPQLYGGGKTKGIAE